eukprot:scaffold4372_cov397-Prasinococcus_capsulatus_cf.AAC.19
MSLVYRKMNSKNCGTTRESTSSTPIDFRIARTTLGDTTTTERKNTVASPKRAPHGVVVRWPMHTFPSCGTSCSSSGACCAIGLSTTLVNRHRISKRPAQPQLDRTPASGAGATERSYEDCTASSL